MRASRAELLEIAERYFSSAADGGDVPPSAAACRRRQNGVPMEDNGSCTVRPGTKRFMQLRYPVVDETNGVAVSVKAVAA